MRDVTSFATPFESCGDREAGIIREVPGITNIRLSEVDESFAMPRDPFHIKVTSLNIDRALYLFDAFECEAGTALFVYAGHSYDFALTDSFGKLETLIRRIKANSEIKNVTMGELPSLLY